MGLIYFLAYLFLEIIFSYKFASIFTPVGLFLEILLSAGAGIFIIQTLNFSFRANIYRLMRKEITQEEFLSIGLFKLIGALLLIIPGIFSDILGILFLFEPFARFVAKKFLPKNNIYTSTKSHENDNDIIDVEIIEDKDKKTL